MRIQMGFNTEWDAFIELTEEDNTACSVRVSAIAAIQTAGPAMKSKSINSILTLDSDMSLYVKESRQEILKRIEYVIYCTARGEKV